MRHSRLEHNGKYLHNGRPHAVFRAPDSSDAFYQKIDQLLEGRIESEDIRHLAAGAYDWALIMCPVSGGIATPMHLRLHSPGSRHLPTE